MKFPGSVRMHSALIEWPTVGMIAVCMLCMPILVVFSETFTLWVSIPLLVIVLTLHSSLQHEVLHGHPFKNRYLNEVLVFIPAGLFLPYNRFRDTHLQHHADTNLTCPHKDPESNYLDPATWHQLAAPLRALLKVNNTLAGRMLLGPMVGLYSFYAGDLKAILKGDIGVAWAYVLHAIGIVALILWFSRYATMPAWAYASAAYGAMSLLKIRTFLEHRAHKNIQARTVIIESRGFFALLFLNNNLHLIHHNHPGVAWYRLPALYANQHEYFSNLNDGYIYANYAEIFSRYMFRAKDVVPHPLLPVLEPVALQKIQAVD